MGRVGTEFIDKLDNIVLEGIRRHGFEVSDISPRDVMAATQEKCGIWVEMGRRHVIEGHPEKIVPDTAAMIVPALEQFR